MSLSKEARNFATVVVARARAAAGGFQEFAVLRDLKGVAPHLLRLRVGDAPADAGKLHLLLLSPAAGAAAQAFNEPPPLISVSPAAAAIAGATPSPEPSPGSTSVGPAPPPPRRTPATTPAASPPPTSANGPWRSPRRRSAIAAGWRSRRSFHRAPTSRRCTSPDDDFPPGRVDSPRRNGRVQCLVCLKARTSSSPAPQTRAPSPGRWRWRSSARAEASPSRTRPSASSGASARWPRSSVARR